MRVQFNFPEPEFCGSWKDNSHLGQLRNLQSVHIWIMSISSLGLLFFTVLSVARSWLISPQSPSPSFVSLTRDFKSNHQALSLFLFFSKLLKVSYRGPPNAFPLTIHESEQSTAFILFTTWAFSTIWAPRRGFSNWRACGNSTYRWIEKPIPNS